MKFLVGIFFIFLTSTAFSVDTTITGGEMELRDKGETVFFKGGVHLRRGNDTMKSQEMSTNKNRDQVTAVGHVQLFRKVSSTENWKGKGDQAYYETQNASGYLLSYEKRASLRRTEILSSTMTRVVDMFAKRFDFFKNNQFATANGHVYGKTIDSQSRSGYEFWSNKAEYDGGSKIITLSGWPFPKLVQKDAEKTSTLVGENILYNVETQKLVSKGNAMAVFTDLGEKKK
ncbi:MAG: LptA/OstA family protein [Elusimicrobiota bacterium]